MPDENNKEYKNLVDLFAGVHQKVHYLGTDYMLIREDKFQNFIDFIMYLDVKFDILERQIKNHRHGDGGDAWPVPTEESLKCRDSTFREMTDEEKVMTTIKKKANEEKLK